MDNTWKSARGTLIDWEKMRAEKEAKENEVTPGEPMSGDQLAYLEDLLKGVNPEAPSTQEDYSKAMSTGTPTEIPTNEIPVDAPMIAKSEPKKVEKMQNIIKAPNAPKEEINPLDHMTYNEMMKMGGPTKAEKYLQELEGLKSRKPQSSLEDRQNLLKEKNDLDPKKKESDQMDELEKARWLDAFSSIGNSIARYGPADNVALSPQTNFANQILTKRKAEQEAKRIAQKEKEMSDYRKKRLDNSEKDRKLRIEKEENLQRQRTQMEKKRYLDSARGLIKDDPRFKKAVEQGMEFEAVDRLVEQAQSGNQAALAALGTKLARAMGEVGVLTDTDVVRYVGGTSWGRKLQDWAKKGFQGELSEDTIKDISENLTMLKGKLKGDVNRVYGNAGDRMKSAYPELDDDMIQGLLGKPMVDKSSSKKQKKELKLKEPTSDQVKKYSEMHNLSEDQAKQILIKRLNR